MNAKFSAQYQIPNDHSVHEDILVYCCYVIKYPKSINLQQQINYSSGVCKLTVITWMLLFSLLKL